MVFQYLRGPPKFVGPLYDLPLPVFNSYESVRSAVLFCRKWYIVVSEKASLRTEADHSRGRDVCISSTCGRKTRPRFTTPANSLDSTCPPQVSRNIKSGIRRQCRLQERVWRLPFSENDGVAVLSLAPLAQDETPHKPRTSSYLLDEQRTGGGAHGDPGQHACARRPRSTSVSGAATHSAADAHNDAQAPQAPLYRWHVHESHHHAHVYPRPPAPPRSPWRSSSTRT